MEYGHVNRQLDPAQTGWEAEKLESDLRKRIVGQDAAIEQIISIYSNQPGGHVECGTADRQFSVSRPTGSGKTRLVEATAESLLETAAR